MSPPTELDTQPVIGLRIDSLESANSGVTSVKPDDTLEKVQSLMMRHDYSQLAVMSGVRDLRGAVSWESIARARIRNPAATLKDAMVPAETLRSDDDLLAKIPVIQNAGYAFVIAHDNRVAGVVTPYDLSEQFANLVSRSFFSPRSNVGCVESSTGRSRRTSSRRFETQRTRSARSDRLTT